jgi:hypothetical protein
LYANAKNKSQNPNIWEKILSIFLGSKFHLYIDNTSGIRPKATTTTIYQWDITTR